METIPAATSNSALSFRLRSVISAFIAGILAACAFYHAIHGGVAAAVVSAVLMLGALARACSQAEAISSSPTNAMPEPRNV